MFTNYYHFPLKVHPICPTLKIATDDNKMAFDWCLRISEDLINKLIAIINGELESEYTDFSYDSEIGRVLYKGLPLIQIRGWGMLTDNPYHLPDEEAIKVQNEFGEYIIKRLNNDRS